MQDLLWVRIVLAIIVHVILFAIAMWDLAAIASGNDQLTVSSITQEWAKANPVLTLALGVVIGHLFWPVR